MGCVYKLTSPSCKSYIGITSLTLEARWIQHQRNAKKGRGTKSGDECLGLYNAIRKYGSESFKIELLCTSDDWDVLCSLETEYIKKCHTFYPEGYNLTLGGEGSLGNKPSEETLEKMRAVQRQVSLNTELASKRLEYLAKAVKNRAEKWHARSKSEKEEWGKKHGAIISKSHSTEESKAKRSMIAKLRWADPEFRKRALEARRGTQHGHVWTEEQKETARQQRIREWADPEMRKKRTIAFALARQRRKQWQQPILNLI